MIANPLDVRKVVFIDWDNTSIGELIVPKAWKNLRQVVNFFIAANMIHPAIRDADPASLARTDNYRGKYPHMGPGATEGAVDDGEDYPLTGKLDYAFFKRKMTKQKDGVWRQEKASRVVGAAFTDPFEAERNAKRTQAKKDWPRRRVYPEEAWFYEIVDGAVKLSHSLRFLPDMYLRTTRIGVPFRPGREE